MHAFDRRRDRQTDGQTACSSLVRAGISCSAEKSALGFDVGKGVPVHYSEDPLFGLVLGLGFRVSVQG